MSDNSILGIKDVSVGNVHISKARREPYWKKKSYYGVLSLLINPANIMSEILFIIHMYVYSKSINFSCVHFHGLGGKLALVGKYKLGTEHEAISARIYC